MKCFNILFLLLLMFSPVSAQEMEMVIPPRRDQITKNIHLIIDYSGSMEPEEIRMAVNQAIMIAGQPGDEFNVAITVFGQDYVRMEILDEECELGPNWMAMPSQDHLDTIIDFLGSVAINDNSTLAEEAVRAAINEEIDDLTVIIISDCVIQDRWRLPEVMSGSGVHFGFVGIDSRMARNEGFMELCEENDCWFINIPKENDE